MQVGAGSEDRDTHFSGLSFSSLTPDRGFSRSPLAPPPSSHLCWPGSGPSPAVKSGCDLVALAHLLGTVMRGLLRAGTLTMLA